MLQGFWSDLSSYVPGKCFVDLQFTAGTSGAVPSTLTTFAGIASVTKTVTTGKYTITLSEPVFRLTGIGGSVKQASYSKTGACDIRLLSEDVQNAKTIDVLVVDGDGD